MTEADVTTYVIDVLSKLGPYVDDGTLVVVFEDSRVKSVIVRQARGYVVVDLASIKTFDQNVDDFIQTGRLDDGLR